MTHLRGTGSLPDSDSGVPSGSVTCSNQGRLSAPRAPAISHPVQLAGLASGDQLVSDAQTKQTWWT